MSLDGLTKEQKEVDRLVREQIPRALALPEPDRSKCIMCLAYEYFNQDMEEKAFKLIEKADPNYFKDQLAKDMQDPQIKEIVFRIMGSLMSAGYIKVKENDGKKE